LYYRIPMYLKKQTESKYLYDVKREIIKAYAS